MVCTETPNPLLLKLTGTPALLVSEIVYLQADSNYSRIHLADGTTPLFAKTLRYFGGLLPHFVRIHRGYLVNPAHIEVLSSQQGHCTLTGAVVLPISRRKRLAMKNERTKRSKL